MNLGAETEEVEFKKSTSELKEGMISLASMLNKNGRGVVYYGVRNDGEVIGQQIGDRTLREISQAVAAAIRPQIIPTIAVELMDERNVVRVTARGTEKPYSAYGRYYMRSADEDREIAPAQLRMLMLSSSDSIVNMESNNQQLTFDQLRTLYAIRHFTLNEDTFRQNLNLLTKDGSYNLMAALLSDSNSFSMKVAAFRGTDKTELIRRNEYGYKCVLLAMQQVMDYMESINETTVDVTGGLRKEETLFDFPSFREAWLNACLHNRWSRMTPPAVYVFEDRIEVISIGGLPEGLTLDDFYAGKSRPVNLELQQIMVQLDYIEQTGHGVPLIVSRCGKEAFDITENFITVTIPLRRGNRLRDGYRPVWNSIGDGPGAGRGGSGLDAAYMTRATVGDYGSGASFHSAGRDGTYYIAEDNLPYDKSASETPSVCTAEEGELSGQGSDGYILDEKDREILHLMKENDRITTKELSEHTGMGTTTITVRIRRLRESGAVQRVGARKNGRWVVR